MHVLIEGVRRCMHARIWKREIPGDGQLPARGGEAMHAQGGNACALLDAKRGRYHGDCMHAFRSTEMVRYLPEGHLVGHMLDGGEVRCPGGLEELAAARILGTACLDGIGLRRVVFELIEQRRVVECGLEGATACGRDAMTRGSEG